MRYLFCERHNALFLKSIIDGEWENIKADKAHLVYSDEDWSCFGEIAVRWNAYGKKIYDGVTTFYINVNYAEED